MNGYPVITATAFFAPEKIVTNDFFNKLYGKDVDTFLRTRRNIIERRHMDSSQTTSDLIVPALQQALSRAKIGPEEIDLLIVATDTPDYMSPSTASVVQHKLQLKRAGTFDINAACAGFVTALDSGFKYMQADSQYQNVAVVGAYGMSKFLNYDDHRIATLFADGAGVAILQRKGSEPMFLGSRLFTLGEFHDYMGLYAGGTFQPFSEAVLEKRAHLLDFAKKIPLETNSTHWPRLIHSLCDQNRIAPKDIAKFFLTQINIETINETLKQLGLPLDRSHNIMDRYGYTGSASIGMALADANEKGLIRAGDYLALVGSGGGVSMAAMLLRWA